jgi:hypothetical protein
MNTTTYEDNKIAALDLDAIKSKLMHRKSGERWSPARADAVECEYRRFLYLMKIFPGELTAPDVDVDTFWHYHILDTMKYAADCDLIFGYFLHHFPYIGMRGAEDSAAHQRAGERMRELYDQVFGARCERDALQHAFCGATSGVAFCGATTATAFCGATGHLAGPAAPPQTAVCGSTIAGAAPAAMQTRPQLATAA